jgi:hypothetical protein
MSQDDGARTTDARSFGPFLLFARERRLERDGHSIKIGSRALDVLIFLTERAGTKLNASATTESSASGALIEHALRFDQITRR